MQQRVHTSKAARATWQDIAVVDHSSSVKAAQQLYSLPTGKGMRAVCAAWTRSCQSDCRSKDSVQVESSGSCWQRVDLLGVAVRLLRED